MPGSQTAQAVARSSCGGPKDLDACSIGDEEQLCSSSSLWSVEGDGHQSRAPVSEPASGSVLGERSKPEGPRPIFGAW